MLKGTRNSLLFTTLLLSNIIILVHSGFYKVPQCDSNNECPCKPGYWGRNCKFCRLRLTGDSGVITDGDKNYIESSKCSWLIESPRANSTIELEFQQFATECAWDHLFIFAGSSIHAPLLGTLSGLLRDKKIDVIANEPIRHLSVKSNKAFLYFFSDANYILTGFNIKYRIKRDCSSQCSNHGHCGSHSNCVCDKGWTGSNCNTSTCTTSCVSGTCDTVTRQCQGCKSGYTGPSCNITVGSAFWTHVPTNNQNKVVGRASHAAGLIGDWLWVYGGYSLNPVPFDDLIRYHVPSNTWEIVEPHVSSAVPNRRYGHSIIVYNESFIVYGGTANGKTGNELWSYDTTTNQWSIISPASDSVDPMAVSGHTATLVDTKMIVIFGYGPREGYTQKVQQFDLVSRRWKIYNVNASIVHATFGHSSSYEPHSGRIYVYGGYRKTRGHELSGDLHVYKPAEKKWFTLLASGYRRFLHTSVLMGNLLIIFGGNTHNDTNDSSKKALCYSNEAIMYDTRCNTWTKLSTKSLSSLNSRYGHTAVQANGTMYIFGGFQGTMLNDMLTYTAGDCSAWKNRTSCLQAYPTHGCVRHIKTGTCIGPLDAPSYNNGDVEIPVCPANPKKCSTFQTCNQCLSSLFSCVWCGNTCKESGNSCKKAMITDEKHCPLLSGNCPGPGCVHSPCHNYSSCVGCIDNKNCIWCESQRQCVGLHAYVVSFPYGQCHEWTKEKCEDVSCKSMKMCNDCHTLPGCGWCDDGSGTGLGQCLDGGDDGPFTASSNSSLVPSNQCQPKHNKKRWFFIECPVCQCNGHSTCDSEGNCKECKHNSNGTHCQTCASGYHGDPKNGGTCQACECNQHGHTCNAESGVCHCHTKGVSGNKCELCEHRKSYYGNSTNGGRCYYNLTSGFMFTFNVTGYSGVSFLNIPKRHDRNVQFSIKAIGDGAMMNMSYQTKSSAEIFILKGKDLGEFEMTFKHDDFDFASISLTTFYVYIYNVKGSCMIEISFSQGSPFALLKFFLTFFGCFFSILVVTFIAWKIRVRYNHYIMRRQRLVEMHQMANRPTSTLNLSLEKHNNTYVTKCNPNPVTMQPFTSANAAVATFVFRLPSLPNGLTPIGQSGMCFGSVLIDHRNNPSQTSRCYTFQKADKRQRRTTTQCI